MADPVMPNQAAPSKIFALQALLAEHLQSSLSFQNLGVQPANIPLNRIKSATQTTRIKYVSAIALKLTPRDQDALSLAQQIAKNWGRAGQLDPLQTASSCICQDLKISTAAPGWIYLELSAVGLASWLQYAASCVFTLSSVFHSNKTLYNSKFDRHSAQIFVISHSHARCCSLLSAADAEWRDWRLGLTQSDLLDTWQPAEWQLIGRLIDAADALAVACSKSELDQRDQQLSKHAYEISLGFEAFYAACPIWGVAAQDHALAHRRLALVRLTQRLLQRLLGLLNLPAPAQL